MSTCLSAERASATDDTGADVGSVVLRLSLPDPEAAELIAAADATDPLAAAAQDFLRAEVAAGRLVLPA
jgi:hypothetical protein